ncbi:hypothetical protein B0H15DRAFT_768782, partial [Mycena belliarum]
SRFPLMRLQVLKPLWPFLVAGSISLYGISKLQDIAVRCTPCLPEWGRCFVLLIELYSAGVR